MLYIILSICCSVVVSVMLKLARRYEIDVYPAITWNYSVAILLSWFFLKPKLQNLGNAPWDIYVALGLLLLIVFVILAASVRTSGIVRTDVAQRLSLIISLTAAFFLFSESYNTVKIIGLAIGLVAIAFCIPWHKGTRRGSKDSGSAMFLPLVFIGFGAIDILFKKVALIKEVSFGTSLFLVYVIAFMAALIGLVYQVATKKLKLRWRHLFFGWLLGLFNFGNILFYLKAHQALAAKPSIVFSSMNLGVIVLGMLIGVFVFKERFTLLNKIGIALALVAIVVITVSQHAV